VKLDWIAAMGSVVEFCIRRAERPPDTCAGEMSRDAVILFFTGVRRERIEWVAADTDGLEVRTSESAPPTGGRCGH
jgi:hypothetical protein